MLIINSLRLISKHGFCCLFLVQYNQIRVFGVAMAEVITGLGGDIRHNRNCYAYLQQLIPFINRDVLSAFPKLQSLLDLDLSNYNEKIAYGNFYSFALRYLEKNIDEVYPTLREPALKSVEDLIFSIYHNNNHILEDGEWLKTINQQIRPQNTNSGALVAEYLEDTSPVINEQTPKKAESLLGRFYTLFTPNFKPQLDTNVPSIKNSSFTSDLDSLEYRFSTQAQRHQGKVRISPLFKHWLAINAQRVPSDQVIAHVYFNNLGLDRGKFDIPGSNEKELTLALHLLEQDPGLKIAVITLPASKGILGSEHYKSNHNKLPYSQVFRELFTIARYEQHPSGVIDFKISPSVRNLLFGDDLNQTQMLNALLTKSFESMGIKPGHTLSTAQKQAVWLHFNKFELTNYILKTLQPRSHNYSCKDAIDRGALSSIYFNLHKSFTVNKPVGRDQFERDIHIAAANVKGRGMNFHLRILWNAIDGYVNTNYKDLLKDDKKSWLIYWRDMNCPHSRVKDLLELRLKHYEEQLNSLPQSEKKIQGLNLLASVKYHYDQRVGGQRFLLEIISRSTQLLTEKPSPATIAAYKNLAQEIKIKHPYLQILAGLLLAFLGAVLFSSTLSNSGLSKINTGFFVKEREELSKHIEKIAEIEEQSDEISPKLSPP